MENASNALMMAGGVLIGILLISVLVVAFSGAADLAKTYDDSISATSLQEFNNNFEKYQLESVNIHTIVTIAHFAKDYNTKNELQEGDLRYITVECELYSGVSGIKKTESLQDKTDEKLIELMKENTIARDDDGKEDEEAKMQQYKCTELVHSEITGAVTKIAFKMSE